MKYLTKIKDWILKDLRIPERKEEVLEGVYVIVGSKVNLKKVIPLILLPLVVIGILIIIL